MTVLSIPARYQPFMQFMDDQLDHFWRAPGSDKFTTDRADWMLMSSSIKRRIKMCIHLLAHMDLEIIDNLNVIISKLTADNNIPKKDINIILMCMDAQKLMEGIHTLAYDRMDRELEYDLKDEDVAVLLEKVEQLSSYQNEDISTQLVAQVCAEGISFLTLFPIFYYLRKEGKLPETCMTNDEVLRDENMHTKTFITMYNIFTEDGLIPRLTEKQAYDIVGSFVAVEDRLADAIYGNQSDADKAFLTVMTSENSKLYTRITANTVLQVLGYNPLYPVSKDDNPFPFVNQSLIDTLVGFFDRDSAEYGIRTDHHYVSDSDPEDE